jgi:hypothetical protein
MHFPAFSQIAKAALVAAGLVVATVLPSMAQDLPKLEGPAMVTSLGQSLDAFQVQLGVKRAGIEMAYDAHFEPDALVGKKSLFLVVGASLKGFGEAGISIEQERDRAHHFITEAQAKGIPIVMVHPGGAERRDGLSNQLLEIVAPAATVMVIRADSDADGRLHAIATEKNIPVIVIENIAGLVDPLKQLYGL